MIAVKGGTKTWSDALQKVDHKSNGASQVSASEQQANFGDQPIGDVLNKLSDPNWIDPAKKVRQVGGQELDKDAFMTLLLTQMKNQDPTNPLKSHEMAAQLAQFTSLEKLSNIDSGIQALAAAQNPAKDFDALGLIGKTVVANGAQISRTDTKSGHDIRFQLSGDAVKTELKIFDSEGKEVRVLQVNNLKSGKNSVFWNGQLEDGTPAKPGDYNVEVVAKSSNGAKVLAESKLEGRITGVSFSAKGPLLTVGNQQISLNEINTITDTEPSAPLQATPTATDTVKPHLPTSPVSNTSATSAVGPVSSSPVPTPSPSSTRPQSEKFGDGLKDVAMSRGMINELKKSGIEAGL